MWLLKNVYMYLYLLWHIKLAFFNPFKIIEIYVFAQVLDFVLVKKLLYVYGYCKITQKWQNINLSEFVEGDSCNCLYAFEMFIFHCISNILIFQSQKWWMLNNILAKDTWCVCYATCIFKKKYFVYQEGFEKYI